MKAWIQKDTQHRVAVVAGVRTPFAKAGADLKNCTAVHLGVSALKAALARAELGSSEVDEVVFGNAGTPADAANISRVISLRSGLSEGTPAYTVHRNCASAMEAIAQGCLKIGMGLAEVMAVGGTESMSNVPLIFGPEMTELFSVLNFSKSSTDKLKKLAEFRPQWLKPVVSIMEGLTDPISGLNMIQTAEVLARDFKISRQSQDTYALRSHLRTVGAQKEDKFKNEIHPILIEPDYKEALQKDVGPRESQTLEALQKLRPIFDRENGTITPGNSCPITDGAVALILMNEARAQAEGRKILGTMSGFSFTGCEPKRMGMGPIVSSAHLLDSLGIDLAQVALIELNEAFAAQVLAVQKELSFARDRLNIDGGAIALGHPLAASGARLVVHLISRLSSLGGGYGLASACIGGGQGMALLLKVE